MGELTPETLDKLRLLLREFRETNISWSTDNAELNSAWGKLTWELYENAPDLIAAARKGLVR